MTNIVVTLSTVIITNWTTVSITIPQGQLRPHGSGYGGLGLAYGIEGYSRIEKQAGRTQTNTVARFEFEGRPFEVLVRQEEGVPVGEREVPVNPRNPFTLECIGK